MKLRLRSLQSKETHKLEVPDDCSIHELKELLSNNLSSSFSLAPSLRLSLNRKDELSSQSPHDSLLSIGITSGDLIYYDLSSAQQGNPPSSSFNSSANMIVNPDSVVPGLSLAEKSSDLNCQLPCEMSDVELLGSSAKGKEILVEDEKLEIRGDELMDIDSGLDCNGSSVPYFLKRVLCEEMSTDFSDTKLVFLAIHAVFLESGFVGFDSVSGLRVDCFDILREQAKITLTTTVSYTLPELLSSDNGTITESVVLKFQTLGHYINVLGSLASSPVGVHKLNIDKTRFVPAIGHVWVTGNENDSAEAFAEEVIYEFWKIVKDGLALPLMIDLCEKTGLELPPCLMRLPADLKFRILELLCGQDTARVACVCKELCFLSSNNELWKQKYMSEYGSKTGTEEHAGSWKTRFELSFLEDRKKRKRGSHIENTGNEGAFRDLALRQYVLLSARGRTFRLFDAP